MPCTHELIPIGDRTGVCDLCGVIRLLDPDEPDTDDWDEEEDDEDDEDDLWQDHGAPVGEGAPVCVVEMKNCFALCFLPGL